MSGHLTPDFDEQRRGWRENWLTSIQEFADEETQRRRWLDPTNLNPHWSFVEYMCCYFDNLNLSDPGYPEVIKLGFVSEAELTAVVEFHNIADHYDSPTDSYDHEAILADPKWTDVVDAARQAITNLLTLLDDPREVKLLTQP